MIKKQKVLVVGAGFGGVKAALGLVDDERFKVTLLSEDSELRYYPTLYHTATGGKHANSSIPLQRIFEDKAITILRGSAVSLDRKAKTIETAAGEIIEFDSLVLSLGVVTNYFGIEGLKEFSYSIKTQSEVERFKAHLHQQMIDGKRPDLNYVIVGAGPTGIELAGALPHYLQHIMKQHGVPVRPIHVDLIEASPRLLPRMPKETSRTVQRRLKRLGVRLYTNSVVQGLNDSELTVSGKPIRSHTVVWTAGVTNHPFFAANQFVMMGRGKIAVDTYLQTEPGIFVIGDNANTPYSGLAQTAIEDGAFVARNLRRQASGRRMRSYNAKVPVSVIPAGPHWAAVNWNGLSLHGLSGWLLREAADFVGFADLEPLDQAAKQYLTGYGQEDRCTVCATANA